MFNTLKEMQETISYEDLCKYTYESFGKSPAEIKELLKSYNIEVTDSVAKECFVFMESINVINDDQLDNVSGGHVSSSNQTFEKGDWLLNHLEGSYKYRKAYYIKEVSENKYTLLVYKKHDEPIGGKGYVVVDATLPKTIIGNSYAKLPSKPDWITEDPSL